jgi:DeoR/GlpR family transcriptional regulator of sugar metabolism
MVMSYDNVTIPVICREFHVSAMTARRDLRELDRKGLIKRVHGGAISPLGRSYEPPYRIRQATGIEAKQKIGRAAAEMILDGDSIFLDIGTTTMEIARSLEGKHDLTIITASLPIANEIVSNPTLSSGIRLILTGGVVRPGELSMIGHVAERTLSEFHADKAFIGVGGLTPEAGLTEFNLEDALTKRQFLGNARRRIVVADSSKLGRTAFAYVGPLSIVDEVVTDKGVPDEFLQVLRNAKIKVTIAG